MLSGACTKKIARCECERERESCCVLSCFCLSLFLCVVVSGFASLSLCLCVLACFGFFVSLCLCVFVCVFVYFCLCVFESMHLRAFLGSLRLIVFASVRLYVFVSLCTCTC